LFVNDVRLVDLKKTIGHYPKYILMGTESGASRLKRQGSGNAGVTLYNIRTMYRTYKGFIKHTFSTENLESGLHYGGYGAGDQGAYNSYYDASIDIALAPFFNWKPYWKSEDLSPAWDNEYTMYDAPPVAIIHWHGPKPAHYRAYYGNRKADSMFDTWKIQTTFQSNTLSSSLTGAHNGGQTDRTERVILPSSFLSLLSKCNTQDDTDVCWVWLRYFSHLAHTLEDGTSLDSAYHELSWSIS
jgi:hypothetical protein